MQIHQTWLDVDNLTNIRRRQINGRWKPALQHFNVIGLLVS